MSKQSISADLWPGEDTAFRILRGDEGKHRPVMWGDNFSLFAATGTEARRFADATDGWATEVEEWEARRAYVDEEQAL